MEVYSNCEEVQLLLNGKSLGTKSLPANASARVWRVPFDGGTLRAEARNKAKTVAVSELRTAGKPARIQLSTDRIKLTAGFDDIAVFTATVVDANGVEVPSADRLIHFQITGPGAIAAVDSADNSSHESFQSPERHAFQGHCIAIVRASAPGRIQLSASAEGLVASSALTVEAVN